MWKIDAYHDLGSMIIALVSMVSWHKLGSFTLQYRKHSVVSIKCLSAECENIANLFKV